MRLEDLKGVGKARLEALERAGMDSVEELLWRLPKSYTDYDDRDEIAALTSGRRSVFLARIKNVSTTRVRGATRVAAKVFDATGEVSCVWFQQPYRAKQLEVGAVQLFCGLVTRYRGVAEVVSPQVLPADTHGIVPVYAPIRDIPAKTYAGLVRQALDRCPPTNDGDLPDGIRQRFGLLPQAAALRSIHFPESREALAQALRTFSFRDLLFFALAVRRQRLGPGMGRAMKANLAVVQPFLDSLPYALTGAQERVLRQALSDMESDTPMARLVEGDVGCGKTIIALALLYCAFENGCQGALMAPTEVLAHQHAEEAQKLLAPFGVRVALLTGSLRAAQRRETLRAIEAGEADLIVGTHALIMGGVRYHRLGLVVTDEQHRFGVRQRLALEHKGEAPHVLVMSATPIPRTMALVLYGELDVSVVDELPPGRKPVATRIVPESKRQGLYGFLRDTVEAGQQVYVVCPLVEESEVVDAASAARTAQELAAALPKAHVELLHGRMKGEEKEKILDRFAAGETQVLVSTTVIEVGVNVPNATVMVIEDAERFGLAQLHQLRGRVGRGEKPSWCFLMADRPTARLRALTETNDGFVIAQKDLALRGPGELLGTRQSGMADERTLALFSDATLLPQVQALADEVFSAPDAPENRALLENARRSMALRGIELARN
ncbi:MAG: ATP-dependent DNA helicase RecG [Candidatus Spyradocola sp.]|jgi:ATP-dependent DNA helicase RecG